MSTSKFPNEELLNVSLTPDFSPVANASDLVSRFNGFPQLGLTRPKAVKTADANREQPSPGLKADVDAEQTASLHFLALPMAEMDRGFAK